MWLQQIFIASLSVCLILNVAAVVNNGQTKKIETTAKTSTTIEDGTNTTSTVKDLVAESSEQATRREGANIPHTYEVPPSDVNGHFNLPVPIYGVPSAPSNNVIYPAPPPDIPPSPSKSLQTSLYGTPTFGKTYGVPQINPLPPVSKGYNLPPIKYNFPSFSSNQFSTNLIPPKPLYGPPKNIYGPPGKPFKYPKYPSKGFGTRPTKPVYGPPLNFKENFNYKKLNNNNNNNFNTNSFGGLYTNSLFSNNAYPSLYSGISSFNHQYGAPIIPPNKAVFSQYGSPNTISSTQYDLSNKQPVGAYGPPQPSPNPRPPHPGAPAPPTPPDIKYDGWQPIPGLVSKKPTEEIHHVTGQGSGYHDLSSASLNIGNDQLSNNYGAPSITLDLTQGNSLLDQPGLSNSYELHINPETGSKTGISDSYHAPLGTVTGSGGIVASSGAEAHGGSAAISQPHSHSGSQGLSIDISTTGLDHGSNIQATKSVEYEISPHGILDSNTGSTLKISDSYYAPQVGSSLSGGTYGSKQSYNNIGSFSHGSKNSFSVHGHKNSPLFGPTKGLVPPSGLYGVPPSSQFGTPLYTNSYGNNLPVKRPVLHREPIQHGVFQNIAKESYNKDIHSFGGSSSSLYVPPPPAGPSTSYGVPSGNDAISYQNVVHGSSTDGIDLLQNSFNGGSASSLLLNTYNTPLESTDDTYKHSSSDNVVHVALDYSHPLQTIDFTQGKHASLSHECVNNQHQNLDLVAPQALISESSQKYGGQDLTYSSSIKSEAKVNSIETSEETHGKNYGKSVAESFGPNSELVESQSIDLNNISLQGNLGSYTLQIQSADNSGGQVPHTQVLNDGLLQSILQAIEQPGKEGQNNKYPIILQPSIERDNYSVNETISNASESQSQSSEIREVIVEAPKNNGMKDEQNNQENEETLQLLDTGKIALYYKKDDDATKVKTDIQGNTKN